MKLNKVIIILSLVLGVLATVLLIGVTRDIFNFPKFNEDYLCNVFMGILVSSIFAFIPSACSYIFKKRSHLTKVYLSNLGLIKGLLGVIDYIENSRRIDDEFHSYDEMITKSQKDLLELLLENSNIFIPHKLEKISEVLLSNYVEITEIIMEIRKCRDKYESQLYSLEECNGSIDLYKNELVSNYKSELLNYKNRVLKYEKKYDKVITSNF